MPGSGFSRTLCVAAGAVLAITASPAAQTNDAASDRPLLRMAAARVDELLHALTNVVIEEDYRQTARAFGGSTTVRRTRADVIVVLLGRTWVPFRDVFDVDGRSVRDRDARLARLLTNATADSVQQALAISNESARFNLNPTGLTLDRTINTAATALIFLQSDNQPRSSFRLEGLEAIAGRPCRIVSFAEHAEPSLVQSTDGRVHGRFWIEPETGRVCRSELDVYAALNPKRAQFVRARVTVTYARDPTLGLWVPRTMDDSYDLTPNHEYIGARATYSHLRRFGVTTGEQVH